MATKLEEPLDEMSFADPGWAHQQGGIHDNSVLFYFALSPFFDPTSNNAVIASQAMFNPNMYPVIQSRARFEAHLKTMAGLEYIVAQEPAETNPGAGTGVWIINKQSRRKRHGQADEVHVHAAYFVVGLNIYPAPSMADLLTYRFSTITTSLDKLLPAAKSGRTWSPATGHIYKPLPAPKNARSIQSAKSKDATPLPDSQASRPGSETANSHKSNISARDTVSSLLADHSARLHVQHGGEYMDENPIIGKPGSFQLSSTGHKEKTLQIPSLNTSFTSSKSPLAPSNKAEGAKSASKDDAKTPKTPKTPTGMSKPKRKKSKQAITPTATSG